MSRTSGTGRKGILLDTTRCVGCGACYQACKEQNQLPKTADNFLQDNLSANTFTVVNNRSGRFVRRMCMHCEEPTCASVCPVGALQKTATGAVVYDKDKCFGCRYCMQACPFGIPKYEWESAAPYMKKCDMCSGRQARGLATACATACPTGATQFGDREELIREARQRMAANPGRYSGHIFGVEEAGGTSVLVISDVSVAQLGYPDTLPKEPLPQLTWYVLEKIPKAVSFGGVLLGGIWWITKRRQEVAKAEGKLRRELPKREEI